MRRYASPKQREHKGKSLLKALDDYVAVDIETTGLSSRHSSIIELGAIRYRNDRPVEDVSLLVNPGFEVSAFITDFTGITNDMLWPAPYLEDVLPFFLDFVGDDVILGHNVNFDVNFIYDKALLLGLPPLKNDFIDTMRLSRRLYPEHRHHKLADLVERFGIERDTAHRALADCYTTAACYQYMKRDM